MDESEFDILPHPCQNL